MEKAPNGVQHTAPPAYRGMTLLAPPVSITHTIALPSEAVCFHWVPAPLRTPRERHLLCNEYTDGSLHRPNDTFQHRHRPRHRNLAFTFGESRQLEVRWFTVDREVRKLFIVEVTPVTTATSVAHGVVQQQQPRLEVHTNASLNGNIVISRRAVRVVAPSWDSQKPS